MENKHTPGPKRNTNECERAKRQLGPSNFTPHDTVWAEESGVQVAIHKINAQIQIVIKSDIGEIKATVSSYRWDRLRKVWE